MPGKILTWLIWITAVIALIILGIGLYFYIVTMDRNPGFEVNLTVDGNPEGQLHAGFAAVSITPRIPDQWTDVNGDAQYIPEDGDTFQDGNGNGRFDPVWIAGRKV